jgi:hypothetical protein
VAIFQRGFGSHFYAPPDDEAAFAPLPPPPPTAQKKEEKKEKAAFLYLLLQVSSLFGALDGMNGTLNSLYKPTKTGMDRRQSNATRRRLKTFSS